MQWAFGVPLSFPPTGNVRRREDADSKKRFSAMSESQRNDTVRPLRRRRSVSGTARSLFFRMRDFRRRVFQRQEFSERDVFKIPVLFDMLSPVMDVAPGIGCG